MHYLYILFSEKLNRFYVGETSNVEKRLIMHNQHVYKNSFTKSASDWVIHLSKKYNNKNDALYIEKFIKRMKSRKFIEKIINDNEILDDILTKRKCP